MLLWHNYCYYCGVKGGVNMKTTKISIKFYFQSYKDDNNKHKLNLRVSEGREFRKYIVTPFKLNKSLWDPKNEMVSTKHSEHSIINTGLLEYKRKIDIAQAKYQANVFTAEMVFNYLSGKTDAKSLDNYVESHYKNTFDKTKYNNTKDRLRFFKQVLNIKKPLLFDDVTLPLIKKYQRLQQKRIKEQEISATTASAYVSNVMSICNEAFTEGAIQEEIKIPSKYIKFEKLHTGENYSNTTKELFEAIEGLHTMQRWEAVGQWLLMFGMRGIYQADIPSICEGILMEDSGSDKSMPFVEITKNKLNNWYNATLWLDHRRRKRGNMPMFIKLNRSLIALIEKLKYSYMYTHTDYQIGNKYIVSDVNDRVSIMHYDVAEHPKEHHSLWRNRQKLLKKIHPELVRFKDARKTFFQLAEQVDNTLTAKQLCGQTIDSLASNFYSNYKNKGIVEKIDALHDEVLREFKFSELVSRLVKKFHELVETTQAPKWLLKQSAVFQEGKEWRVLVGFVDRKPQYQTIDKKYKRFLNDESIKDGYWADFDGNNEKQDDETLKILWVKIDNTKKDEIKQLENSAQLEELQLKLKQYENEQEYLKCAEVKKQIEELV